MKNNNEIVLVLSGQICRENSADLKNFWAGFINIQRNLNIQVENLKIIGHSWNPEYDDLISSVYSPSLYRSEKQPNFLPEFAKELDRIDRFEVGLRRVDSLWRRVTPQSLLGNGYSRSKAAGLLVSGFKDSSRVIFARWDQGQTGSREVNQIIYDSALPYDYIYMANYSEIDEGYADMWIVAPIAVARSFQNYYNFVIDCLTERNNYVSDFSAVGWPHTIKQKISNSRVKKYIKKVKASLNAGLPRVTNIYNKITNKLKSLVKIAFNFLPLKYKNKFENYKYCGEHAIDISFDSNEVTWPLYQALNNHALLKYFIIMQGFREKTRFLDVNDFQKQERYTLINPIKISIVIYSHSSYSDCWQMAVMQAIKCMPRTDYKIIMLSEESEGTVHEFKKLGKIDNLLLITYNEDAAYTDRLISAFEEIRGLSEIVYFMHEDMPLYQNIDAVYLNSLVHYLHKSTEFYIKLVDTNSVHSKNIHSEFPGLVSNTGGYSISIQPSLIKCREFSTFLTNFKCNIYEFENICERSNLKFSSVGGGKLIGKSALVNNYFPHVITAIHKGKWSLSEWGQEIRSLAKEYNIDLQVRGAD